MFHSKIVLLMRKNEKVAKIELFFGKIYRITEIYSKDLMPLGTYSKSDEKTCELLSAWWKNNSIPTERDSIRLGLQCLGISSEYELKVLGHGLSLINPYWIKDENEDVSWEKLNYWDNGFSKQVGEALFDHKPIRDKGSICSPDSSINGMLKKKWITINGEYYVAKSGSGLNKEEIFNEILASKICNKANIPNADYKFYEDNGQISCISKCLTDRHTELIHFSQIMDMVPRKPWFEHESELEHAYEIFRYLGIRDFKERINEILCLDYILAGTDRHCNNIAVLHNEITDSYSFCPVYDSGNCLWNDRFTKNINVDDDSITARPFCNENSFGTWDEQKKFITGYINIKPYELIQCINEYSELISTYSESSPERIKIISNGILKRAQNLQKFLIQKEKAVSDELIIKDEHFSMLKY